MRAVLFTVIALCLFYQCSAEEIHYGPGVMAPSEPHQARLSNLGWRWKSSLTRKDTGNGACELVWVKQMKVL